MATNFPTALDDFTNPSGTDRLDSVAVPHATQHANLNDAVEAIEAKVGINGSLVTTSLDYRVGQLELGGGGVTDHGALTGLADDDHTQYHTDARGDARYAALGHNHSILALTDWPAALSTTELGYLDGVTSGIQGQLNGKSDTGHNHTGVYEPANAALLDTTDIGVLVASQTHNHSGVYEPVSAAILRTTDIGTLVAPQVSGISTTEIGYLDGVTSGIQSQINGKSDTGHNHSVLALTDWPAALSTTELGYLDGVTSGIQAQLNNKADTGHNHTGVYQPLATVLTNTTASFTTALETKLNGIAAGAEVNVNADWNSGSGDSQILNKPTLGTAASKNITISASAPGSPSVNDLWVDIS